jgi:lipopolysaccharide transport system permease protein
LRHGGENLNPLRSRSRHFIFLTYQFDVITHLVARNFVLRYKGSALGVLWSLLVPLSQLLVFAFIFGKVLPLDIEAYPAFLFIGVLPWNWFSTCVTSAGLLFISNRDLVRKPNFIPSNLIIVDVLANLLNFMILLPVLFFIMVIYQREVTLYILFVPFIMVIQIMLTIGLSLIISILNVFYRDIQHIVSVFIMLLFFITPVFYSTMKIDKSYKFIYEWNPIAAVIDGYRATFYYGLPPDWGAILYATIFSIVIYLAGYTVYRQQLHKIFDLI